MENNFNFFNRVANSKEDETTPRLFSKTPRRGNRVGLKAISEKIYNENKTPLLNEGIGEQYDVQTEQKLKKFTEPFDFEEATAKDKKLPAPFIKIKKWGDEETAKVDQNKPYITDGRIRLQKEEQKRVLLEEIQQLPIASPEAAAKQLEITSLTKELSETKKQHLGGQLIEYKQLQNKQQEEFKRIDDYKKYKIEQSDQSPASILSINNDINKIKEEKSIDNNKAIDLYLESNPSVKQDIVALGELAKDTGATGWGGDKYNDPTSQYIGGFGNIISSWGKGWDNRQDNATEVLDLDIPLQVEVLDQLSQRDKDKLANGSFNLAEKENLLSKAKNNLYVSESKKIVEEADSKALEYASEKNRVSTTYKSLLDQGLAIMKGIPAGSRSTEDDNKLREIQTAMKSNQDQWNAFNDTYKQEFENLNTKELELQGVYGIDFGRNIVKNNFKLTDDILAIQEVRRNLLGGTVNPALSLISGTFGLLAQIAVGAPGWAMSALGDIGTDDTRYSKADAFSDMLSNAISYNVGVASTKLFEEETPFFSKELVNFGAELVPFTAIMISEARKGGISSLPKKIGGFFKPSSGKVLTESMISHRKDILAASAAYKMTVLGNYKEGQARGLSDWEAQAYGQVKTLGTVISQQIMPDYKFLEGTKGKILLDAFAGKLSTEATKKGAIEAVRMFSTSLAKEFGEEEVEAAFGELASVSAGLGASGWGEFVESQKQIVAGVSLLSGGLGSIGATKTFSATRDAVINAFLRDSNTTIDYLNDLRDSGIKNNVGEDAIKEIEDALFYAKRLQKVAKTSPENVTGEELDLLVQKEKVLEARSKADDSFYPEYDAEIAIINEKIADSRSTKFIKKAFDKDIELTKNLSEALEVGSSSNIKVFSTEAEQKQWLARNGVAATDEDAGLGEFYTNPKTKERFLVINEELALKQGVTTTGRHEGLHLVLSKMLESNPNAAIELGGKLLNELNAVYGEQNISKSVVGSRLKQYNDYYNNKKAVNLKNFKDGKISKKEYKDTDNQFTKDYSEEILPILAEALTNKEINYSENLFKKIGYVLNSVFSKGSIKTDFSDGKNVFKFIRDYNKTFSKGDYSRSLLKGKTAESIKNLGTIGEAATTGIKSKPSKSKIVPGSKKSLNQGLIDSIENEISDLYDSLSTGMSQDTFDDKLKKLEDRLEQAEKVEQKPVGRQVDKKEAAIPKKEKSTKTGVDEKKLGNEIDALVGPRKSDGSYEMTKDKWDKGGILKAKNKLIDGTMLEPLIRKELTRYGVAADNVHGVPIDLFLEDVKNRVLEAALLKFNPEKNNSLGGFIIGSQFGIKNRIGDIVNKYKKQLSTQSIDAEIGGTELTSELMSEEEADASFGESFKGEKPKFKTLLEAKIISSEAMSTVTNKILTFVRTLKSRIDAPVSLNKTVTPLISEIRDAAGKMIDIDLKTEMGGKKDRVLEKWLLKHKKAALENMTTTWLMGKDMGTRVDGGMPIAIQKRINGEWLNYPAWIGKKVDRESTSTDLAGRTSGSDLVRRLPNVNNSISDADFLATIIGEDGNPIRGRKESFAKAVAEELAFDVINNDLANGGVISEALAVNQERNGYERANNMIADVLRQSERGNIKFSIALNLGMLDDVLKSNIEKKLITLLDFYSPEQKLFAQEFIDGRRVRKTKDKQRNAVIDELRVYNEVIGKHVSTKIKTGAQEWSSIEHEERLSILIAKNKNNRAGLLKAISSLIASEVKSYNSSAGNVITKNIEYFYYILKPALIANGQKDLLDDGHISIKQWEVKGKTRTAILINNKKIETPFAIINSKYKISKGEEFAELGKKEWDADADTAAAYFIGEYNKFKGEGFTDESLLKFTNFLELIKNDMLGILHKMSKMGMYVTGLTATDTRPEHNTPVAEIKKKFIEIARKNGSDEDILAFLKEECRVNFIPVVVDKILSKTGAKFTALNRYSEKRMHNLEVVEALMEYEGRLNDIADAYGSQKIWNELVSEVKYLHSIGMTGKQLNEAWDKAAASRAFSSAPKGISVFDFDDTVAYTKGTVLYTMPDETTGILNAEEFAKEGGALFTDGATFDFSNFDVVTDGKPGPMAQRMKDLIDKFGAKDVFILTARNPNAAEPIHQFLESIGINIPIENITGLGNSNAKAKADWMVGKVAEGYNDFYFSDDAIQNVKAVADVLSQYDIKSDVVQAKIKFSLNMSDNFNKILEESAGIESYKKYSDIVAKRRGAAKGKYRFFIPPSAEDFTGLLYDFLGRGKQGEDHMDFFNQALIEPYTKGVALIESAKRKAKNDFKAVMDAHKTVAKKLGSLTPEGDFTYDQAIRVFMWTQGGQEIPGISKRDAKKLNDLVESDPELLDFSKSLVTIGKQDNVWVKPGEYWDTETIISDLNNITEKGGRKKFLEEFITNADEIFSKENLNKIEANFGTNFRSALEDSLFRMKSGKNRSAGMTANEIRWNDWVNNSTGAIMFFNTRSAILQLISSINFLNWSDNNPAMAAMAFANQPQYWKDFSTIFNSDKLKERRAGLKSDVNEAEIANAAAGAKNKAKAILAYLLKIGFTPTQIADSFAISSGGATFYRNRINTYIKNGLTKEEAENKAWEDFSKISDSTQQSGDPMLISQQQASSIGRLILAFVNTPLQYNRLIKKAARDLQNKRGDVKTNISKIIYYGALQNLIFSGLQTALFALAFDDDDEEDKREKLDKKSAMILNGMLDTILKGSGMAGAVVATIKNTAMKYMDQEDKGFKADYAYVLIEAANVSPPIGSKFRKLYSGMKNRQFEKEVIAERGFSTMIDGKLNISPAWNVVGKVVEATTNLPMDRLLSKVNNVAEGLDSRNASWQRIALLLGWSPRNVNVVNEESDLIKAGAKVANKKAGIEKGKATRAAKTQAKKDSIANLTGKAKEDYEQMLLDKKEATKLKRKLKSEKKKDSIEGLSKEAKMQYRLLELRKKRKNK